jgi:hypothetical protein
VAYWIEALDPGLHHTKDFRCGSDSQDNALRPPALEPEPRCCSQSPFSVTSLLVDAMRQCPQAGQILDVRFLGIDVAGAAGEAECSRLQSL